MKLSAMLLILVSSALNAICQPIQVSIPIEKAELINRDLARCRVTLEELASSKAEADSLRGAAIAFQQAAELAKKEAGAQKVIAGLCAKDFEACQHEALEVAKINRAKLWKVRAVAAGGWLLACVFGYLAVAN